MNMKFKKTICFLLVLLFAMGALSGCSNNSPESTTVPAEQPTAIPTVNPATVVELGVSEVSVPSGNSLSATSGLNSSQLKAINTLNYLTSLLQDIHDSKQNRIYLQEAFTSLKDNIHPDIDPVTQAQIIDMLNTMSNLRMLAVKRDHLEYIYEQKRAQALKAAIPNPLSVLNVVQSGNPVKAIASLAFMAIDSVGSYLSATADNDLQYLQDGWDLDEQETKQLDQSQISAFSYMVDLLRNADLHKENALLAMNQTSVAEFIKIKNTTNLYSRIQALKDNEKTYSGYGGYWLLLAQSYYELGQYENCLNAFSSYESLNIDIFRKDHDYANIIPLIISAASETKTVDEYIPFAQKYLEQLMANCENNQWNLRYFAAITYLDLYSKTGKKEYIQTAFDIAKNNVNYLIKEQTDKNVAYLKPVEKLSTANLKEKDKKEAEQVNKAREEKRKTELPPVYEPLWLNCTLLFSLAPQIDVPAEEKSAIEAMLHENGIPLFLSVPLDDACWFESKDHSSEASQSVEFKKGDLYIPVKYINDESKIIVFLYEDGKIIEFKDWMLENVERKSEGNIDTFIAKFKSEKAASHNYADNGVATIKVYPKNDSEIPSFQADFKAVPDCVPLVNIKIDLHFERIEK